MWYDSLRTVCRNWFFYHMAFGIELRSSGLMGSSLHTEPSCWPYSLSFSYEEHPTILLLMFQMRKLPSLSLVLGPYLLFPGYFYRFSFYPLFWVNVPCPRVLLRGVHLTCQIYGLVFIKMEKIWPLFFSPLLFSLLVFPFLLWVTSSIPQLTLFPNFFLYI